MVAAVVPTTQRVSILHKLEEYYLQTHERYQQVVTAGNPQPTYVIEPDSSYLQLKHSDIHPQSCLQGVYFPKYIVIDS